MNAYLIGWHLLLWSLMTSAQSAKVRIDVTGVAVGKGPVVVNIYDSADHFFKQAAYTKTVNDAQSTVTVLFDLPAGRYALSVYQDTNNNKRLDQGWFNVPTEPVGFGNNFRPRLSAPRFEDCAVLVNNDDNQFTVNLFKVF
ncbi:DUF2141 domain-containing protein [Fibrella aquatilis]|uniref:DUF2141 domain-containing protein n=1 Tax=Fibrella aquatilis TaxID=2817059 RepID=A0A939G4K1_9BACT|nr:DUF2141 domain-containing protein [Fibrella aquatilis]MBO0931984.1 DUF2141 domain-containing protein [Fibrella aquatilis]